MTFYGRIKGLKGKELGDQIAMLLTALSLNQYANRKAGTFSGGNKRKLSVAIAMIGNPPIVFLDEVEFFVLFFAVRTERADFVCFVFVLVISRRAEWTRWPAVLCGTLSGRRWAVAVSC